MKKLILLLLLVPIVSFSQDKRTKKVLKKIELRVRGFDATQPISIEIPNDTYNIGGEFENALFFEEFDMVSNRVASDIVKLNNPLNQNNLDIKLQKYREVKSVYVIDIKAVMLPTLTACGGAMPKTLTGSIIDMLNDGKLVGTFKFKQSNMSSGCLGNVAEAFAIKLKELAKN